MSGSMLLATGAVALLAILVGYAVPTLIQIRRTARAAEDLMVGMKPRLEGATSNLDSVLGRLDRLMNEVEGGTRAVTIAMGDVSSFLSRFRPRREEGPAIPGLFGTLISFVSGVFSIFSGHKPRPSGPETDPKGGTPHE